ncbi:ATP-binding protein [Larkinella humicola]|uniref:ATP-binding protein n=1 Tax=Larkinella humicola TaxID=2607654 RepID=A0A5N1JNU9_9BACT|nr:ATP-binding protein [Larkinella humicola]KAA9356289.1 ATP-binding protein [Larkinella humicola]
MIDRQLTHRASEMLRKYPIITITGPRQSGKTTLAKFLKPDYRYVSLERLAEREFARQDPKGFLETYQNGVILDEVQYVPDLFSYLQVATDERQRTGEYILTGSQNFLLMKSITQSLAGRVAVFNLLPLSWQELRSTTYQPASWETYIVSGSYPRKLVHDIDADGFYDSYLQTYVERDVRQVKNILNLNLFQKFIQLLAGRIGQLFNQQSLAVELGIDNKTVNAWLTVLETSFIAYRLPPYYQNFSKRIVKTPKVYFYDTGLAAYLLGIRSVDDLGVHFARGALFENLIINELTKNWLNQGQRPPFYFWSDQSNHEIDLLIDRGKSLTAVEIKSGRTIQPDFFKGLDYFQKLAPQTTSTLVYGGNDAQQRTDARVLTINELDGLN